MVVPEVEYLSLISNVQLASQMTFSGKGWARNAS